MLACAAVGALVAPAHAFADTAGGGASAPGAGSAGLASPLASSGGVTTTPAGPDTLAPPSAGVFARRVTVLRGQLTQREAGQRALLQLLGLGGWRTVASARVAPDGSFAFRWRPREAGRFTARAVASSEARASSLGDAPSALIEVYRPVIASWYGPGFYGSRTACGEKLSPQLLGVANRTLPCGTLVDLSYKGRTVSVPVIDRGPYAAGVSFDLTGATAHALGVSETVRLGALAVSP
jgi:hypothetical protein